MSREPRSFCGPGPDNGIDLTQSGEILTLSSAMTVEVAVLNTLGIAMAADSAQTVGPEWGQKIFTSADKIFALSWEDPIGIMVYGSAELIGLPWETIVKEYRRKTATTRLRTVDDHTQKFLSFIASDELFSQTLQDNHYIGLVAGYYRMMRGQIRELTEATLAETGQADEDKIAGIIKTVLNSHCSLWSEQDTLESVPDGFAASVRKKHEEGIRAAMEDVFEKIPLSEGMRRKLVDLAISLSLKWPPQSIAPPSISGVVIAGFGRDELFPVLRAFEVLAVVDGAAIHRRVESKCIDIGNAVGAAVVAFAQEDVVSTFMEGVAPYYQATIETLIRKLVANVPGEVLDEIPSLTSSERESLKAHVADQEDARMGHYLGQLREYRRQVNVDKILDVVSVLPKDELASMAEALANLTSLKRRLTMGEAETVGGPIDVAVISKGDGLVWIKRKHYFQKDLNPHFFTRHQKGDHNEQEEFEA
jgi:hypothetical protein